MLQQQASLQGSPSASGNTQDEGHRTRAGSPQQFRSVEERPLHQREPVEKVNVSFVEIGSQPQFCFEIQMLRRLIGFHHDSMQVQFSH